MELCFCVCIATDIDRAVQQCGHLNILNKTCKNVILRSSFAIFQL